MSGVLRWEEPPTGVALRAAERAAQWQPVADTLRGKPGDWAVIQEGPIRGMGNLVTYIRKGVGPFAPEGAFEALQRTDPQDRNASRTGKVYARYVGGVE